jgi:hypothetical protein
MFFTSHRLPNPRENEKVIIHIWPHPFIFFKIFLFYFLLFLVPIAVYFLVNLATPGVFENPILLPLLVILCFTYYLLALVLAMSMWVDTYLDVWTITNKRIINREQKGLFNRLVSELELHQIQDVAVEQKGFLSTFLNYGFLYIQTAAARERFIFKDIAQPVKISRLIQGLAENAKKEHQEHEPIGGV